ncbi:putative nuclease HARBI1 [Epinephelus moara]|uniref:putative nuclease HARBI1 n=1 Tax=Epinephelus moara TaxID=300413 RepID=UPI00214ECB2D|nr:putative nuclease HARBI1 [Epinephelus moara]
MPAVLDAIISLAPTYIQFPYRHHQQAEIKRGFHAIAGFPNIIGAIDCTHIPISAPLGENEGDYVDRHNRHSLNVQMTCDPNCLITSVDARWPGSVHDSRVFNESTLCRRLQQGDFSGVLLGDRGYALQPYLMTPYPEPDPGPQALYNRAHNSTRARIEQTFGLLKARFACLRQLRVAPDRACKIVAACCVLHNIATIRRERDPQFDLQPPDVVDPIHLDFPTGRAVREAITLQFM